MLASLQPVFRHRINPTPSLRLRRRYAYAVATLTPSLRLRRRYAYAVAALTLSPDSLTKL